MDKKKAMGFATAALLANFGFQLYGYSLANLYLERKEKTEGREAAIKLSYDIESGLPGAPLDYAVFYGSHKAARDYRDNK